MYGFLMKILLKIFFFTILLLIFPLGVVAQQDAAPSSPRTPEQEAQRQTERMKIDLDLSPTQEKLVYNINLKYERERQISNKRSDAIERIKNKNEELKKALTEQQFNKLQKKRFDQSTFRRQNQQDETKDKPPAE